MTLQMDVTETNVDKTKPKEKERDKWGGQMEFLLACLGNAVGLGNCWRFPYLCYKNGGGAFLFPYSICCLVLGMPLFLIELGLGQFSALGPAHLWENLAPLFRGVGMASVISSAIVAIYYNMIISWTLFYLIESFMGQSWQTCNNAWNTANCTSIQSNANLTNASISSSEEFFNNYVLTKSSGIEEVTNLNWKLSAVLFFSWVMVVLALIKGIQSSGKVVYFTATFPYIILTVLLVRGMTLEGSLDGLRFLFTPNWARIKEVEVWRDAAVQVFYSFGVGGGGMITYASYNRFRNPVLKHAILVGMGDFLTSIFCGSVVFAMIGYMAFALNKPIDSIVQSGTGLAFIVIPEGLSKMPISILWAVMFFFMLFLLGIDSQFAMVETLITYIFDAMRYKNYKLNKPLVVSVVGVIWFLTGLPLCTDAGVYILNLMDTYSAGIPCLVIGLLEIVIVVCFYGLDSFFNDLKQMTNWQPGTLVKSHTVVVLAFVAPLVIIVILYKEVASLFEDNYSLTYGSYHYPKWATWAGWGVSLLSLSSIPIGMVWQLSKTVCYCNQDESFSTRFVSLFRPTDFWWKNSKDYIRGELHTLEVYPNEMSDSPAVMATFSESNATVVNYYSEANGHVNTALNTSDF